MNNEILCKLFCLLVVFSGCSDENNELAIPEGKFEVNLPSGELEIGAEKNMQTEFSFVSTLDWIISIESEWLTVMPRAGKAGENNVTLISKETNATGEPRVATITLKSKGCETIINVIQPPKDVIILENNYFNLTSEEHDIHLRFASNINGKKVLFVNSSSVADWIKPKKDANTRVLEASEYILTVTANKTRESRRAVFNIQIWDENETPLIESEDIVIEQQGLEVGISADFSADKKVKRLQTHTVGNGFPIVVMGDGFLDTDIASGCYENVMKISMENLFSMEPMKSLRSYFDVWMMTCVSKNNAFTDGCSTAIGCKFQGNGSTSVIGSEKKLFDSYLYTMNQIDLENALVVVVVNSNVYAGTTAFGYRLDGIRMSEFAVAYCPMVDGVESDRYRRVLCHESIGHGLAKLMDEYAYENNGGITSYKVEEYERYRRDYGWAANVCFSSGTLHWQYLLDSGMYDLPDANGELLGVYEGACGYWTGAWRPTDDSMMNHNRHGFNAPSREAIYRRVMTTTMGSAYIYTLEEFLEFDRFHLPEMETTTKALQTEEIPLGEPIFKGKFIF